jgi:hypothetical protein
MRSLIVVLALALTGCGTVKDWVPSFWDDNEAKAITDVRWAVNSLNCSGDYKWQVVVIDEKLMWLELYSESKGSRDVVKMIKPFRETVTGLAKKPTLSETFCGLKKKIMISQSNKISDAMMWRY